MTTELSLENIAKDIEDWRNTKESRTSKVPDKLASAIKKLAKHHNINHIAKALKMSWQTIYKVLNANSDPLSKRINLKSKKVYDLDEKLALCQEWMQSGLGMTQFCKTRKISRSSLYQWSRELYPKKNPKKENWIPVIAPQHQEIEIGEPVSIELSLPNQLVARIKIGRSEAVSFFKEICHAATIIR